MRVHRIDLYSNDLEVARFDTNGPDRRNPYVLKSVEGLDAEQITPKFYGQGLESGMNFTSLTLEPREVTMRVALQPTWHLDGSPADLRGNLQRAIASNRSGLIQLRFYDNEVVVGVLEGFITKFGNSISTKDDDIFITVKCENPLIRSMDVTSLILGSLVVGEPKVVIDPVSTAPHGFYLKVTFDDAVVGFEIYEKEIDPDWRFVINYNFIADDELYISSDENNKYLYRVRSAVTLNLADTLEVGSIWPVMFPGENSFFVNDDTNLTIDEWYWYETHWGI